MNCIASKQVVVFRVLFVGDVFGSSGRRAVGGMLEALRSRLDAHFVVVNGENAAGGLGITSAAASALLDAGADVITLGNHAFAKRDVAPYLDEEPRILRPANYPPGVHGRGWGVFDTECGEKVAVVNLLGRTFMAPVDCPFRKADDILAELEGGPGVVIVDIHAEATSERIAMGWHLDGRVSAVIGTHTHVQTSDERVLPGGTAYITDVGMTGVRDSVLGLDVRSVLDRFKTQVPGKFKPAEGEVVLSAVLIEIDPATGRAEDITRINIDDTGQR